VAAFLLGDALLAAGAIAFLADTDDRLFLAAVFFLPGRNGATELAGGRSLARAKASRMTASASSNVSWRVSIVTCIVAPGKSCASGPKLQLQRRTSNTGKTRETFNRHQYDE
jgi:hypothetical protein